MKADPAAQRRLLDLAEVDAELTRLAHRRRNLPEHAALVEIEKRIREANDTVVERETAANDLDRDIRRLEREVESVRARAERDRKLLAGPGVSAKQAADLQHELETLARRQEVLEDEQLEVMERREAVGMDLDHARRELEAAKKEQADLVARRDQALADIDAAEKARQQEREEIAASLPADLLATYERRREQRGTGAALLRQRRCGSCRLELDRTALTAIRNAPADEVVYCEECGVILVRTEESGL